MISATPLAISAIDAISPAINRAKQQLLRPFRWGFWLRMAVVAFFAGEIGGGGFSGFNPGAFNTSGGNRGNRGDHFLTAPWSNIHSISEMMPWSIALAFCVVVLLGIFLYLHSVFRFILFDAVLTGTCRIRQGWTRWHSYGLRYLVWLLFYSIISLAILLLLVGLPIFAAWQAGILHNASSHVLLLVLGGILLFLVLLALGLLAAFISMVVRDFLVPIVALEDVTIGEAWHKFTHVVASQKGAFAGYFGMKILLALGVGVIVGIVDIILLIVLLIPAAIVIGIFVAVGMKTGGAIVLAVLVGLLAFMVLLFVMALTSVPGAIFFQSYTFYFLASRYAPLAQRLFPPAPPAPAVPVIVPEPPLLPA